MACDQKVNNKIPQSKTDENKVEKMFSRFGLNVVQLDEKSKVSCPDFFVYDENSLHNGLICEVKSFYGKDPKLVHEYWDETRSGKLFPAQKQYKQLVKDDPFEQYIDHPGTFKSYPFVVALLAHQYADMDFHLTSPMAGIFKAHKNHADGSVIDKLDHISALAFLHNALNIKEHLSRYSADALQKEIEARCEGRRDIPVPAPEYSWCILKNPSANIP